MDVQFITDSRGEKKAVIIPFDEWERTEKAKDLLEHVYLAGIIEERKGSSSSIDLDGLLKQEGFAREQMEVYRIALKRIQSMRSGANS